MRGTKKRRSRKKRQRQRRDGRRRDSLRVEMLEPRRLLFATDIHQTITGDALSFVDDEILSEINSAHVYQNTVGQFEQAYHFHGSHFRETADNINTWYRDAIESADPVAFDDAGLTESFGKILHAVQDFYAEHNIVDWLLVELRTSILSSNRIFRRSVFINDQGWILDTDGSQGVKFGGLPEGNYFIVLYNRNHLPVMSASQIYLTP